MVRQTPPPSDSNAQMFLMFSNSQLHEYCHADENKILQCDVKPNEVPVSARFQLVWQRPGIFSFKLPGESGEYCGISGTSNTIKCNMKRWNKETEFKASALSMEQIFGKAEFVQRSGCASNYIVGNFFDPASCIAAAKANSACAGSGYVMYPNTYETWGCRCCINDSGPGELHDLWDLYKMPATPFPTLFPTQYPTKYPTNIPTRYPTQYPTNTPTKEPTVNPTKYPTRAPTGTPTNDPTPSPTNTPTTRAPTLPTCDDGIKNGAETDIDCGGSLCPGCTESQLCNSDRDCLERTCVGGTCAKSASPTAKPTTGSPTTMSPTMSPTTMSPTTNAPTQGTCFDGVKNGKESDVDCGGNTCPKCGVGKDCRNGTDCIYDACLNGRCMNTQEPTTSPTRVPTVTPTAAPPPLSCYTWNGDYDNKTTANCKGGEVCGSVAAAANGKMLSLGRCVESDGGCKDLRDELSGNRASLGPIECVLCGTTGCNTLSQVTVDMQGQGEHLRRRHQLDEKIPTAPFCLVLLVAELLSSPSLS